MNNLNIDYKSKFIRHRFLKKCNKKKYCLYKLGTVCCCPLICCCNCCFAGFLIAYKEQKYLYNINKVLDNYESYQCVNTPLINQNPTEYKDIEYEKTLSNDEKDALSRYQVEIDNHNLTINLKIKDYTCKNCGKYDDTNIHTKQCKDCNRKFI
ncbi:MAG TPA: hypothetical protein VJ697_00005 [Nitrososphaeraceae archaeon]|nr:hypothetical protein [Nitrososphaeraceae archaeon]